MPACPTCGAENPADNEFCTSCGKPIGPSTLDGLLDAGIVCPECDTYNDASAKKCVRCGTSLSGLTGFLSAVIERPAEKPSEETVVEPKPQGLPQTAPAAKTQPQTPAVSAPQQPAKPAAVQKPAHRPTDQMPAAVGSATDSNVCPHCRARLPGGAVFCLACGKKLSKTEPVIESVSNLSIRLRLTRGYGREDSTFPVGPQGVTVGRTTALINVASDPFLSPLHMTLRVENGKLSVEDNQSFNGTFLRIRGRSELRQGTEFIAGGQRIVLLGFGGPTTDVRTPASDNTRPYGGPTPKQLFIALRMLHGTSSGQGLAGAVILRSGPKVSVGQHGCDINFPGDKRMAARHFELNIRSSGLEIVESSASNGVFKRIHGATELKNGDELMAGEEVFRIEIS